MLRVVILIVLLALPALAETRQHGNVIFDIPKGWDVGATLDDGTLTLLSDLPNDECKYCYIYITPGYQGQSRLDSYLFSQVSRFIDDDKSPDRKVLGTPDTLAIAGRPGMMLGQTVDGDIQLLMAVQLFGHIELVAFEGPASDEVEAKTSLAVFQRDAAPLLDQAKFVSEGATPLMPPPQPGPLSGLYWGFSTSWVMGLDGMMTMQLDHRHLTFWPDGTFYDGTPPQGLAPFDPADRIARADMLWGNYRLTGDALTLAFASGEVRTLQRKGDDFVDGEAVISKVTPLTDGATISGSISSFFYSGFTPGSGVQGGMSASSLTAFSKKGLWTRESSGGGFGNFDAGGGFASDSSKSEGGSYEIRDGLIIRSFNDGTPQVIELIYNTGTDIMIGDATLDTSGG